MHTKKWYIYVELRKMKKEETLDYHFRKIWHGIARVYNGEAVKHGYTMSWGFALLSIEREGTPSTKLGPLMGMEPRSLTRMIRGLEADGLIEKKADESDRRIVRLYLTERGKKYRQKIRKVVLRFNEKIQANIPKEDMEAFFRVCESIEKVMDQNDIFNND